MRFAPLYHKRDKCAVFEGKFSLYGIYGRTDFTGTTGLPKISYIENRRAISLRNSTPVLLATSVPCGARFYRVQVPNPPGSGKDIAEGKGVAGDCKSEGSRVWGTY